MLRLHDVAASPFSRRVWIALEEKRLPYERVVHSYEECDAPDFPHPFHVTPVLEAEGHALFESLAIVEWLDEAAPVPRLLPEDRLRRARARAFAAACEMNFQRHFRPVIVSLRGPRAEWPAEAIRDGIAGIEEALPPLERELAGREWLVGEAFSIADLAWAPFLALSCEIGLRPLFERHPAVRAWLDRLLARPSVAATRVVMPWWSEIPTGWLADFLAGPPGKPRPQ
jgi:glutathione S-transferase